MLMDDKEKRRHSAKQIVVPLNTNVGCECPTLLFHLYYIKHKVLLQNACQQDDA